MAPREAYHVLSTQVFSQFLEQTNLFPPQDVLNSNSLPGYPLGLRCQLCLKVFPDYLTERYLHPLQMPLFSIKEACPLLYH